MLFFAISEGEIGAGLFNISDLVGLNASRPSWIVEIEVQAIIVVGGNQTARGPDVSVIPGQRVIAFHSHFRDLLAPRSQYEVVRRTESVGRWIAAHRRDASLGNAISFSIVKVASHTAYG